MGDMDLTFNVIPRPAVETGGDNVLLPLRLLKCEVVRFLLFFKSVLFKKEALAIEFCELNV
ncbi:hypothetical protein ACH50_17675 [Franconibacter pulveris]|uniref:Uncharacterized protein n=1 Tax=Franconibacter pulveris TaxID=435910 RepID=A0A0J8VKQ8_9ENTR|nr:hypothetical protein ACH50_17675 [Franconibacter pulveris]